MRTWIVEINAKLTSLQSSTRIVDWYGHTGNFVVESPRTNRLEIASELASAVRVSFAVLSYSETLNFALAAEKAASPPAVEGKRWTSGIAFAVKAPPCQSTPKPTLHAVFFAVSDYAVGAWKEDQLVQNGILDKERRGGGWGAVSGDISKESGGIWTARSLRTIKGTLEKAKGYITQQSRGVA
jgi:hypothetical protein